MNLLKKYTSKIKGYKPDTDEYDFTLNDCKNLIKSTKKWLELEKLIQLSENIKIILDLQTPFLYF